VAPRNNEQKTDATLFYSNIKNYLLRDYVAKRKMAEKNDAQTRKMDTRLQLPRKKKKVAESHV